MKLNLKQRSKFEVMSDESFFPLSWTVSGLNRTVIDHWLVEVFLILLEQDDIPIFTYLRMVDDRWMTVVVDEEKVDVPRDGEINGQEQDD